jgi:hypothetical protein
MQRYGTIQNRLERFLDFLLDAAVVGLPLPAVEMSAQVLNHQSNSLGFLDRRFTSAR